MPCGFCGAARRPLSGREVPEPMDILYLLIPVSLAIVFAIGVIFWWAISAGQFDELDHESRSVVRDDDAPPPP